MRVAKISSSHSLDEKRRVAGLAIAKLARLSGIPYQRVWLALTGGNRLTVHESDRLEAVLRKNENQP